MSRNTKKILGIVVIVILILAVIWVVYENIKPEPANVNISNELPDENVGIDNIINDIFENEVTNTVSNEIVNEVIDKGTNKNEESNTNQVDKEDSETVSGTATTREEKAIELAKEYYEEEYGSTEGIYFRYEGIKGDGRYIIRAGTAGTGRDKFFFIDLKTGIVEEK